MRYMIMASQFQVYHKTELELVKKVYQIIKNIIKVLDLGWSLML